jgi:hypothetical protein
MDQKIKIVRFPVFLCMIDLFSTPHKSQPLEKIENLKIEIRK